MRDDANERGAAPRARTVYGVVLPKRAFLSARQSYRGADRSPRKRRPCRPGRAGARYDTGLVALSLASASSGLYTSRVIRGYLWQDTRVSTNPRTPEIIDVGPRPRRRLKIWLIVAAILLLFSLSRIVSIYISALWFGSLGFSSVYWYIFKLKILLFIGAAVLTALLLSATFLLFQRLFGAYAFEKRTIILNNQPFQFSPAKFIRPLGWLVSGIFGLIYGFQLKDSWRQFALYLHQPPTSTYDPIFGKPLGFCLFSLPLYDLLSSWLFGIAIVILIAAIA